MNIDVLSNWSITVNSAKHISKSTWLLDDSYVLKTGDNLQRMSRNISAIQALSKYGMPFQPLLKPKAVRIMY